MVGIIAVLALSWIRSEEKIFPCLYTSLNTQNRQVAEPIMVFMVAIGIHTNTKWIPWIPSLLVLGKNWKELRFKVCPRLHPAVKSVLPGDPFSSNAPLACTPRKLPFPIVAVEECGEARRNAELPEHLAKSALLQICPSAAKSGVALLLENKPNRMFDSRDALLPSSGLESEPCDPFARRQSRDAS
jgi:hypothetical protein